VLPSEHEEDWAVRRRQQARLSLREGATAPHETGSR
jgi:hypothetical protein